MSLPFQVRAVNTAADSENRIHNDAVAAEYGFRGGLVPGVTVFGYMATAVLQALGDEWLACGAMNVRFFEPFYEGEQVSVLVSESQEGRVQVKAGSRAAGTAWLHTDRSGEIPPFEPLAEQKPASKDTLAPGITLGSFEKKLDLAAPGMAAPLDASIGDERFAHPPIVLALANEILVRNFILGPWIHASSEIRNFASVRDGETVEVRAAIVEAYEKKGHELVVLDVAILAAAQLATKVRHTAIWKPRRLVGQASPPASDLLVRH